MHQKHQYNVFGMCLLVDGTLSVIPYYRGCFTLRQFCIGNGANDNHNLVQRIKIKWNNNKDKRWTIQNFQSMVWVFALNSNINTISMWKTRYISRCWRFFVWKFRRQLFAGFDSQFNGIWSVCIQNEYTLNGSPQQTRLEQQLNRNQNEKHSFGPANIENYSVILVLWLNMHVSVWNGYIIY